MKLRYLTHNLHSCTFLFLPVVPTFSPSGRGFSGIKGCVPSIASQCALKLTCIARRIYVCMYVCKHLCVCTCVCVSVCVYMYVCMYICMYVCMYVRICYVCIVFHSRHDRSFVFRYAYRYTCIHTLHIVATSPYTHTHTHMQMHSGLFSRGTLTC